MYLLIKKFPINYRQLVTFSYIICVRNNKEVHKCTT